jgi:hypothetical protein
MQVCGSVVELPSVREPLNLICSTKNKKKRQRWIFHKPGVSDNPGFAGLTEYLEQIKRNTSMRKVLIPGRQCALEKWLGKASH